MDQAEQAQRYYRERGEGQRIPLGIYHVTGKNLADAYVFVRLSAFEEYFDPLLKAYRLMEELRAKAGL